MNSSSLPPNPLVTLAQKGGTTAIIFGIIITLLGISVISSADAVATFIFKFIGGVLLTGGILQLIFAIKARGSVATVMLFLSSAATIICGAILLTKPGIGYGIVTIILVIYFFVDGFGKIAQSFAMRPVPGWIWVLISGIASLGLAIFVCTEWPLSAAWLVGTLIGIHLIFAGLMMLLIGLGAKTAAKIAK
ncbi:HdeD family acid-resistance protein [Persicirhabdus sediminis]|uniref:DUF308 domain-containing protein n=1 Tax=Persicirhabdus sediminis TaxID=454144 RepID=A0A8J7MGN7_9BACT|nr:DUF308 domain-containing protein [Persicirhabdus sediminis]MBK1791479.1 DUF308 domain-containing protein [Persicirhabdus sediminis]